MDYRDIFCESLHKQTSKVLSTSLIMLSQMALFSTLCILLSTVAHSGSLAAGVSLDRQTPVENKSTVQEGIPFTVTYLVKFGTQSLPETIQFNWSNGFSVDMSSGPINISSVRGEKNYSISDCMRFNINTAQDTTIAPR